MEANSDFVRLAQSILDEGRTMTKTAEILKVHHSKIVRLVEKGILVVYEAFDEPKDKIHLYQNYEWLWEEDELEKLLYQAFDSNCFLDRSLDEDALKIGRYVKENYKSLKHFFIRKGFGRVMEDVEIKCNSCGNSDSLKDWYTDISKLWGLYSSCPKCRMISVNKYVKNNPEKIFLSSQRRRMMAEALPIIYFGKDDWINKKSYFGWRCAISRKTGNSSMDHFIPLAIGWGGTYSENLVPLNKSINSSKNDSNPFLWESSIQYNKHHFNNAVEHLSKENGLTVKEYKKFVEWCFYNKRNIDQVRADTRHSIEIWREATGIQFPLPAYVYKPRINNDFYETNEGGTAN